jgi:5-methylthioadenosine/S-adenosylhomocysteine deaminase
MRLAAMLSRLHTADAMALTAEDALLMATRDGAAALGRDDIGTLEPGKWADMLHVAVDGPHFSAGLGVPDQQLLSTLVWAVGSRAVADVWVGGERVIVNGEPTRTDRGAAQSAAAAAARYVSAV